MRHNHYGTTVIKLRTSPKQQGKAAKLNDPYLREWVDTMRKRGYTDKDIIKML